MTQQDAIEILKLGHNVYLTGSAGSGKTHVLNDYIAYLKEQGIAVGITASTGVAATQINGITINSWAGIGIKQTLTQKDLNDLLKRGYMHRRFANTKVLVIDEISMLPGYMLELVDLVCRTFRKNSDPFGGLQVVLCGDFFQLPPVTSDNETPPFIFKSQAWEALDLKVCYLEKEYRQEDQKFLHVLHEIRGNNVSKPSIKMLAGRIYKPIETISTRLYTHNINVDNINQRELAKLKGSAKRYTMAVKGSEYLVEVMKKNCLAPESLVLKEGALVMFVKNNFEKRYVNGTLGRVLGFDKKGFPVIETAAGEQVTACPAEWTIEEDGEIKAQIRQLPLRLAWAITVHKSQGMSLDAAEIDLRKPFVAGMGYVALSRVRTLEGIRLMGLNHKALLVNEEVIEFDKQLRELSKKTEEELEKIDWIEREILQSMFLHEMQETDQPKPRAYLLKRYR